jgi:hypothetical protein
VGDDVSIDSETLLVTDFVNLKIKPTQYFRIAHRSRVYVRVFIEVSDCTCMSIYFCTVFLKKQPPRQILVNKIAAKSLRIHVYTKKPIIVHDSYRAVQEEYEANCFLLCQTLTRITNPYSRRRRMKEKRANTQMNDSISPYRVYDQSTRARATWSKLLHGTVSPKPNQYVNKTLLNLQEPSGKKQTRADQLFPLSVCSSCMSSPYIRPLAHLFEALVLLIIYRYHRRRRHHKKS